MNHAIHNSIVNFIWGIADDVLRDIYVRGKYRDVILPMTVIRRLDALLEPTKEAVTGMKRQLDGAGIANQHAALCQASGEAFYNVSPFTLRDLRSRARLQQLKADFEAYLDGFSPNVQEILDKFKFRNQIPTLIESDILGDLIEKFLDARINLSPKPVQDADGNELLPALDNHAMGTIFEELIRKFNEDNNEEAGEHFTPRDVIKLMADLIFKPVADLKDLRFMVEHGDDPEYQMVTRSSDGQLMFLVNKLSKMKHSTRLGSRIAEVHNGSSLFTGDAGQGESNIRRWIIENDWLETIIALPENIFYNTGIATYIWLLSNRKRAQRKGKVQLVDASGWSVPLRRNLGKKNCEFSEEHIRTLCDLVVNPVETEQSRIFPNEAFGYWKVTVDRPLRLAVDLSSTKLEQFDKECIEAKEAPLAKLVRRVARAEGAGPHLNFNIFIAACRADAEKQGVKFTAKRKKLLQNELAVTDEQAEPVIKKVHKPGKADPDPLHGRYALEISGKACVVEYEPDTGLRDTEQVPLLEEGGIEAFFQRECLPYTPDAWIDPCKTQIGYEISFTRHFYKPVPMRTLEEIKADIYALEEETEGLLEGIVGEAAG